MVVAGARGHEAAEAEQSSEQVGPEMLEKEENPDPVLMEDQEESEGRAVVGCLSPSRQQTELQLAGWCLEKVEVNSERDQLRGHCV